MSGESIQDALKAANKTADTVLVTNDTHSGVFAILARMTSDAPWVQIETAHSSTTAGILAEYFRQDDDEREDMCQACEDDDWGRDVPVADPNEDNSEEIEADEATPA